MKAAIEVESALQSFLGFLSADLEAHPERTRTLDPGLAARVQQLVEGVEVDLSAPLSADDE
jgi:antitoxin PrlF